jgi:hypothetical protein
LEADLRPVRHVRKVFENKQGAINGLLSNHRTRKEPEMRTHRLKYQGLILALLLAVLLPAGKSACAQDGQVWLTCGFQGEYEWANYCHNYIEIRIENPHELIGMSLGFEISYDIPLVFYPDSTSRPGELEYLLERGRAVGAFSEPGSITVDARFDGVSPDTILITASGEPGGGLPAWNMETCYAVYFDAPYFHVPCYPCIQVDNIFVPPSGTWTFDDGNTYAPIYNGQTNTSQEVPDAPPVESGFEPGLPDLVPYWITVPPDTVYQGHCQPYSFVCEADEGGNNPPADPVEYYTSVGEITILDGELTVPVPEVCDTQNVGLTARNYNCSERYYDFSIIWTNEDPQVSDCPTTTGKVALGGIYSYPFGSNDTDACDDATFAATAFGAAPVGDYSMSQEGVFTFIPDAADDGQTFEFRVTVTDNCGGEDQCQLFVEVAAPLCGDCDGNGIVNVSDAVYLINYVFGGGLPPNPPSVADVDCNQIVNISDAVYEISYIFGGGPAPCEACP